MLFNTCGFVALFTLTIGILGNPIEQSPLRLWRSNPSSYTTEQNAAQRVEQKPVHEISHHYEMTYPKYYKGSEDPIYNFNDALTVSWDADPEAEPAVLHIQCWEKEPFIYENVSLSQHDISLIRILADMSRWKTRTTTPPDLWGTIGAKPRSVHTKAVSVYLGPYKFYHSCRFVLQDTPEKELFVDARAISSNFRISNIADLESKTWGLTVPKVTAAEAVSFRTEQGVYEAGRESI